MKNRARAVAVMVAVLLTGCILGIAGYHFYESGFRADRTTSKASHVSGHTGRLADRLQLGEEQEKQLAVILEDSRRQIETVKNGFNSKLQEIRTKTNEKIIAILNDEQKRKFRQILISPDVHGRPAGPGDGRGHH